MIDKLAEAVIKASEGANIAQRDIDEISTREEHGIFTAQLTITVAESPYTITPYDGTIFFDTSGGVVSATLPTAVGIGGRQYEIIDKGNATANNFTINTNGAETISGAASLTGSVNYFGVLLKSDGINWYTIP